jgi:type 1 glutamine amidotransferase
MRPALLLLVLLAACDGARTPHDGAIDTAEAVPAPEILPAAAIDGACDGTPGAPRVLVYTYENLWRHLSSWYARSAVLDMCRTRGFHVESSNSPRVFDAATLARFDVVVFAVTSGSGMDAHARRDFEAWVRAGGGVVGFEGAAATELQWPFFAANLGAAFAGHGPRNTTSTVQIAQDHPITAGLPASLTLLEQWYVFRQRPETVPGLHVLMTLDESTLPADYPAEYRTGYHALGWAYEPFGGRVFYTGLGDEPETFRDPVVLDLAARAIEWAAHRR